MSHVGSDPRTPHPGVWSPGGRLLTVGLVLTVTLVASEALAVATVMPEVESDLHHLGLYGWVFSGFFLGSLVGIVVAGQACDRMRPVVPFAVGLTLFVVGLVIGGLAGSMGVLVAARVLQGLGAGALPTVAYVAIGREYAPSARPRMFALMSTAWVVPSLVGPGLAAVVGEHWSWRWVFLGLVPFVGLCGLAVIGSLGRMAAPTDAVARGSTLRDALVVAAGAGLVLAGLAEPQPLVLLPLVLVGVALLVPAFGRLTPPGTLRARRGLPAAVLVRGVLTFSFFAADAYVPLALTSVRGTSTVFAGVAVTACSLLWTVGSWVQERRIERTGAARLVRAGFSLVVVGIALLMVTLSSAVPPWLGIVAWSVGGLGIGLAYSPLAVTALAAAATGQEGAASSALNLTDVLGVALGTGVGGVVVAAGDHHGWAPGPTLLVAFVIALAMGLAGVLLSTRLPGPEAPRATGGSAPRGSEEEIDEIVAGAAPPPAAPLPSDVFRPQG